MCIKFVDTDGKRKEVKIHEETSGVICSNDDCFVFYVTWLQSIKRVATTSRSASSRKRRAWRTWCTWRTWYHWSNRLNGRIWSNRLNGRIRSNRNDWRVRRNWSNGINRVDRSNWIDRSTRNTCRGKIVVAVPGGISFSRGYAPIYERGRGCSGTNVSSFTSGISGWKLATRVV